MADEERTLSNEEVVALQSKSVAETEIKQIDILIEKHKEQIKELEDRKQSFAKDAGYELEGESDEALVSSEAEVQASIEAAIQRQGEEKRATVKKLTPKARKKS